jgi:hypothetical protein
MKKLALYKKYENTKPMGVWESNPYFGMYVFGKDEEDPEKMITCWVSGNDRYTFSRNKIHSTASGKYYLRKGSLRIYLEDVMRIW